MKHKFTIFSDNIWPFCYIGKGIVDKLKEEFDIEDEWLPFEIHPETPEEGVPMAEKFPSASIDRMFDNLKSMGMPYGIDFNKNDILSNSRKSLEAGEYSKEIGKFHEFHQNIFRAYFSEGKDIGDIEVIKGVAQISGLNIDELTGRLHSGIYEKNVRDVQKRAQMYEINSAPTFIIDDKFVIVGAQPLEAFRKTLLDIEKQQ